MDDEAADPPKRPPPPAPKPLKRELANETSGSGMRGRGSFLYIDSKDSFLYIAHFTCPMLPLLSHANESSGSGMRQSFLSGSFLYTAHFTYQKLPLLSHATRKGGI